MDVKKVEPGCECLAQWDAHEDHSKGGKSYGGPAWVHVRRKLLGWMEVGTKYVWTKDPSRVMPLPLPLAPKDPKEELIFISTSTAFWTDSEAEYNCSCTVEGNLLIAVDTSYDLAAKDLLSQIREMWKSNL